MITRRGFLGSMVAAPVAASFVVGNVPDAMPFLPAPVEAQCEIRFDNGATRAVSPEYFANVVLKLVTRRLRDLPLTKVGSDNAWHGDMWGSGHFDQGPWLALPNMRFADGGNLILDRIEVDDLARQYAEHVRASGIRYVGRLALPNRLQHAVRVENHRLSLRFLAYWEPQTNYMVGRFDMLGGTA